MCEFHKKVAVIQSNYIPWKGYFDIINSSDLFIFYDDVQFTKNDWRNRNKLKTQKGVDWISVPCGGTIHRLICEVALEDPSWQKSHWDKIKQAYAKAQFFKYYKAFFEDIYLKRQWKNLSELNQHLIKEICKLLHITTRFDDSRNYSLRNMQNERLLDLLTQVGATEYLSGPSAKSYICEKSFSKANIKLTYIDYSAYPAYQQLFPPFVHEVSIIDLLFNEGPDASKYMMSFMRT